MKPTIFFSLLLLFFNSCSNSDYTLPDKQSIRSTENEDFLYKKGDLLTFKDSSNYYYLLLVINHITGSDDISYGLAHIKYQSKEIPDKTAKLEIFGRKVASSINKNGFDINFDGQYISESLIKQDSLFKKIESYNLKQNTVLGAYGISAKKSELLNSYNLGIENRKKPPDHYNDFYNQYGSFHPEEYFFLSDFLVEELNQSKTLLINK